jgi:nucleotide-binding universal stress UspA family protein
MRLAHRLNSRVTLLHVYTLPQPVLPDGTALLAPPEVITRMATDAEEELKKTARAARSVSPLVAVETLLCEGDPATEILRVLDSGRFDQVVLGTEGRGALGRFFIGSTADKVMRRARVPVTTVRIDANP